MHQDTHGWLTVHDVASRMGRELDDEVAWSVGTQIAAAWRRQTGTSPLKDLRSKKSGTGSHCFALYPPAFFPLMERIILAYRPPLAGQLDLFKASEPDPQSVP